MWPAISSRQRHGTTEGSRASCCVNRISRSLRATRLLGEPGDAATVQHRGSISLAPVATYRWVGREGASVRWRSAADTRIFVLDLETLVKTPLTASLVSPAVVDSYAGAVVMTGLGNSARDRFAIVLGQGIDTRSPTREGGTTGAWRSAGRMVGGGLRLAGEAPQRAGFRSQDSEPVVEGEGAGAAVIADLGRRGFSRLAFPYGVPNVRITTTWPPVSPPAETGWCDALDGRSGASLCRRTGGYRVTVVAGGGG